MMLTISALFAALVACQDDQRVDRDLLQRTSAERPAAVPADERAVAERATDPAEVQARADLAIAQARVDLLAARRALSDGRAADAADTARRVLAALRTLPPGIDASVYELQAEGVLARAERLSAAGASDAPIHAGQSAPADANTQRDSAGAAPLDPLEDKSRAAARIARRYEGADTDDIDTRGDAAVLRERSVREQEPSPHYGYRPGEAIVDVHALLHRDEQRYWYERALRTAYKTDEARRLTEVDETRVTPEGDVAFPDDWPEKMARRAKYRGGVVARSPNWTDKDGREWYLAVYDIHDLIYEPPNFQATDGLPLTLRLQNDLDRAALRERSQIFSGYADDLAAGIPLLRYFGGVDSIGGYYNLGRQAEIVDMIRRFSGPYADQPEVQEAGARK
ncbi:MAG: hypothetical protein CHACPFDD_01340 [Phycisphaerae bacterium]|nr:hypothetical protein [Phycisphaerae bacterium]